MDKDFWLQKWNSDKLGFHQESVTPALAKHFPGSGLEGKSVFVPLCGKSKDMLWFKAHGMKVVGCELAEKAVRDFFLENEIEYTVKDLSDEIKVFESEAAVIYQGDIFKLPSFEAFDYIYDRAALIALPQVMRAQYADKLKSYMGKGTCLFLISVEYHQSEMQGPPFSVPRKEVDELYEDLKIEEINREQKIGLGSNSELSFSNVTYSISR